MFYYQGLRRWGEGHVFLHFQKLGSQVGLSPNPFLWQNKCSNFANYPYFVVKTEFFTIFLACFARQLYFINIFKQLIFQNFANLKLKNIFFHIISFFNCLTVYTYRYQCINWQPICSFHILSLSNYAYTCITFINTVNPPRWRCLQHGIFPAIPFLVMATNKWRKLC